MTDPIETSILGQPADLPANPEEATLDAVPNPQPGEVYVTRFVAPEFTSLCPVTGQPDFATFRVRYVPNERCVELKSLKLYMWSFREEGHFHEDVTNRILDDLVAVTDPTWMWVEGDFYVRGGIHTVVRVAHGERPNEVDPAG